MSVTPEQIQCILEAAILVAGKPLTIADMQKLFDEPEPITAKDIKEHLQTLQEKYQTSGIELREVASGYQFQARTEYSSWLSRLWEERAPRYSRAILETLALVAYRQPITRAEIEQIRGVGVSSHIFKTLLEREWVRVIGHRDVPGRPALYATTKNFLDHLNLKSLAELPPLSELKNLEDQADKLQLQLELDAETDTDEINTESEESSEIVEEFIEETEEVVELTENE